MNSNFKQLGSRRPMATFAHSQSGAALVITLIVLLVLTVLGVSSTDSNQIQAALVRNNQFRLEAFNASYSEIDAQIDEINDPPNKATVISDGPPKLITVLISQLVAKVSSTDTDPAILLQATHAGMDQEISSTYASKCVVQLGNIGIGNSITECHVIQLESEAKQKNASVQSNQIQNFKYETFKAS